WRVGAHAGMSSPAAGGGACGDAPPPSAGQRTRGEGDGVRGDGLPSGGLARARGRPACGDGLPDGGQWALRLCDD
ncbi:unnamed protein product, partial [Urochloa humidicola]